MSLKNTKNNIESIAKEIDLLNAYYDDRWSDTIDKKPCYIVAEVVTANRISYEFNFKILDKASDRDVEFESVQSDTLLIFKNFFNQLWAVGMVDFDLLKFEPITQDDLIGWECTNVKVYDVAVDCTATVE